MDNEARKQALLPCPFCGGDALFGRTRAMWDDHPGFPKFGVKCTTPCCPASQAQCESLTENEAFHTWNTRAALQPTSPMGDAEILKEARYLAADLIGYEKGRNLGHEAWFIENASDDCWEIQRAAKSLRAILSRATPAEQKVGK